MPLSSVKRYFRFVMSAGICTTMLISAATAGSHPVEAQEELRVLATIPPLHSIASAVMDGVGTPTLLLENTTSPHHYALTPEDRLQLADADVLLAVSIDNLEHFLRPIVSASTAKKQPMLIEALKSPGAHPLQGKNDDDDTFTDRAVAQDPHIWLDPHEAAHIATALATKLGSVDPIHADAYADNAEKFAAEMDTLYREIDQLLPAGKRKPHYISQHPAYSYFERAFHIEASATLSPTAEISASAQRVAEILAMQSVYPLRCLLHETQFPAAMLDRLAEKTGAKVIAVDPLGSTLPHGSAQYPLMMRALAASLAPCIAHKGVR